LTDPRALGHTVASILCVLDRTNVGSILLATVCASKRLPSDCIYYQVCYMDNCKLCVFVMYQFKADFFLWFKPMKYTLTLTLWPKESHRHPAHRPGVGRRRDDDVAPVRKQMSALTMVEVMNPTAVTTCVRRAEDKEVYQRSVQNHLWKNGCIMNNIRGSHRIHIIQQLSRKYT